MIYFEKLSLLSFLLSLSKFKNLPKIFKGSEVNFFYVDVTWFIGRVVVPLLGVCGIKIGKLDFKLIDVRDKGGELVRFRIPRSDLFEIQKKIIESEAYKALRHESWSQDHIEDFIAEGLVDGGVHDGESVSRRLFIIEVAARHMRSRDCAESVLVVSCRPWFDVYRNRAAGYKIDLFEASLFSLGTFKRSFFYRILMKYPRLYRMLKKIKNGKIFVDGGIENNSIPKVYVEGRGDVNLEGNGNHSDFFWQLSSEFPKKSILYKHHSELEKEYLESHGVHSVEEGCVLSGKYRRGYKKPRLENNSRFREEFKAIEPILNFYDLERYDWGSFFHAHKVKVYLTWNKYYNHHVVVADAIKENGGISAVWQMAFDGSENIECKICADIYFGFSKFSHQVERRLGSSIKYNVITGYPKDHLGPLLKEKAKRIREQLQANGAEKIVFAIDENSTDDERWHTGHGLQQENYSFILEKVLSVPWLGVIFKPKAARTLHHRLGEEVTGLLEKAQKTGRCYIYDDSGRYTTSASPVLAGLSADVCIHGHLSGGTAALECALEGLPTLLIDREGCPNSKLYELPKGKVIFKDWPEAIDAVMAHFKIPQGIPGFGDWSSIIDELDPFRDGKAAYRMGTYLHWLIQGFEQGMEREEIMADAAEKYKKQWGADKVLSI